PIQAKDAIGQNKDDSVGSSRSRTDLAQRRAQRVDVGVRKDLALGLGEANAVDDAGVVQGIADDRGALGREDRDDAGVAGEARLEGQDRLDVLEGGEARLEL